MIVAGLVALWLAGVGASAWWGWGLTSGEDAPLVGRVVVAAVWPAVLVVVGGVGLVALASM